MQRYKGLSALSAHLLAFQHHSSNTDFSQLFLLCKICSIFTRQHHIGRLKPNVQFLSLLQYVAAVTQVRNNIQDYMLGIMGLKELVYCDGSVSYLHWRMMPSGLSVSQSLIWYLWHNILYNVLDLAVLPTSSIILTVRLTLLKTND